VYLHYKDQRCVKLRIGSDNTEEFTILAAKYFDDNNVLTDKSYLHFEEFIAKAKQINQEFRCYDDAMQFVLEKREHKKRVEFICEHYPHKSSLSNLIKANLFPYQEEGILFAAKAGRAMIADEMGLGKTIQAIATAELLKKEFNISNVLIVCPTSLKYQWQSEIHKFTDNSVKVIEGFPHLREEQYNSDDFFKIVSYNTLKNDVQVINKTDVDLVILDEAQRIKNWKTKLAQGVKKINSKYSIVLTGTPLENKLEELYSIIQFIDPFKLGPYYKFLDYYQIRNDSGKTIGYQHLNEIGDILSDVMIRRNKKEVLSQLPERMDKNLIVPMTQTQMDWHEDYREVVAKLVSKWNRFKFLSEQDRQRLMIHLNLMRMVCDSTYLVDQKSRNDTKIDELINILDEYFDGNSKKAVIFSQWERMTRIIAQELDKLGIKYEYLHGGVPAAKRKDLFDNFNTNKDVRIFLSTDAGSTGLNLQSASLIVNMDIPWNPAILEQRISRIHRMGQKNEVNVINLVSSGTIEHQMLGVLKFKTSLSQGILDNGEDSIFLSDDKFKVFMKNVEEITQTKVDQFTENTVITAEEQAENIEFGSSETFEDDLDQELENPKTETIKHEPTLKAQDNETDVNPVNLISQGLNFFSGLTKTLASPEATQKLVSSIVETDEKTGKTFLKIPVESQETVASALNVISQLFKGFSK
jgi:SNF2 family DNA or RNA helicase